MAPHSFQGLLMDDCMPSYLYLCNTSHTISYSNLWCSNCSAPFFTWFQGQPWIPKKRKVLLIFFLAGEWNDVLPLTKLPSITIRRYPLINAESKVKKGHKSRPTISRHLSMSLKMGYIPTLGVCIQHLHTFEWANSKKTPWSKKVLSKEFAKLSFISRNSI